MTWRRTFIIALLLGLASAPSSSKPEPVPVVLEGKTLFHIRERN